MDIAWACLQWHSNERTAAINWCGYRLGMPAVTLHWKGCRYKLIWISLGDACSDAPMKGLQLKTDTDIAWGCLQWLSTERAAAINWCGYRLGMPAVTLHWKGCRYKLIWISLGDACSDAPMKGLPLKTDMDIVWGCLQWRSTERAAAINWYGYRLGMPAVTLQWKDCR